MQTPVRGIGDVDVAVIPMINIVFLLLLYFLVAGQLAEGGGPVIQLPEGGGAAAAAPPVSVVTLDAEGVSYLGARPVNSAELADFLRELPVSARRHHVQLRADARASAGAVHRLLDACREAGIGSVELVTLDEG